MQLRQLFFDRKFQDRVFLDLEHDLNAFKNVPPGLIGTPARSQGAPVTHSTINGFFPGSELNPMPNIRCLCDNLDLDAIKSGPDWARVWCMLLLLMISPRMVSGILNNPTADNPTHQLYINGKTHGFKLDPFHERMFCMMCGNSNGHNAMTPFEIVCRELTTLNQLCVTRDDPGTQFRRASAYL